MIEKSLHIGAKMLRGNKKIDYILLFSKLQRCVHAVYQGRL